MSRNIKFRGKRIDNGEWVYGYYCFIGHTNLQKHYIIPTFASAFYGIEVDPETVGQYTGLYDKNGKEIYEGDVLSFDDMGEEGYEYKEGYDFVNRAVVTFEDGRFTLDNFLDTNSGVVEEMHDHRELQATMEHSEVIGNIYENPELLEVKP